MGGLRAIYNCQFIIVIYQTISLILVWNTHALTKFIVSDKPFYYRINICN